MWSFLAVVMWFAIAVDGLYYLIGLAFVRERRTYALALLVAPAYLIMWIWSQVWSLVREAPGLALEIQGIKGMNFLFPYMARWQTANLHPVSWIVKRPGAIGAQCHRFATARDWIPLRLISGSEQ